MDFFVVSTMQSVFQSDALEQTRPMTYYIESPEAVSAAFDNIAYAKCKFRNRFFSHSFIYAIDSYTHN